MELRDWSSDCALPICSCRGLGFRTRIGRRIFRRIEWVFGRYRTLQIEIQTPCTYCTISSSRIAMKRSAIAPAISSLQILPPSLSEGTKSQLTESIDHCRQQDRLLLIDDRQENSREVRLYAHNMSCCSLNVSARLICGGSNQLTVTYPLPCFSGHGHLS